MIIKCNKCLTPLTTDLYPTKHWITVFDIDTGGYCYIQEGTFVNGDLSKGHWGHRYTKSIKSREIYINPKNYLLPIPEFKEGLGCCNISGLRAVCSCGNELGYLNLDCWQDKHVGFYETSVTRSYK